jgi:hypothetical protein
MTLRAWTAESSLVASMIESISPASSSPWSCAESGSRFRSNMLSMLSRQAVTRYGTNERLWINPGLGINRRKGL